MAGDITRELRAWIFFPGFKIWKFSFNHNMQCLVSLMYGVALFKLFQIMRTQFHYLSIFKINCDRC